MEPVILALCPSRSNENPTGSLPHTWVVLGICGVSVNYAPLKSYTLIQNHAIPETRVLREKLYRRLRRIKQKLQVITDLLGGYGFNNFFYEAVVEAGFDGVAFGGAFLFTSQLRFRASFSSMYCQVQSILNEFYYGKKSITRQGFQPCYRHGYGFYGERVMSRYVADN